MTETSFPLPEFKSTTLKETKYEEEIEQILRRLLEFQAATLQPVLN